MLLSRTLPPAAAGAAQDVGAEGALVASIGALNGRALTGLQRMNLTEGAVSTHDYPVVRNVNVAEGWVPNGTFSLNVPKEGIFSVVERRASLCIPRADITGDAVWILVELTENCPGGLSMDRTFGWKIVDANGQTAVEAH